MTELKGKAAKKKKWELETKKCDEPDKTRLYMQTNENKQTESAFNVKPGLLYWHYEEFQYLHDEYLLILEPEGEIRVKNECTSTSPIGGTVDSYLSCTVTSML